MKFIYIVTLLLPFYNCFPHYNQPVSLYTQAYLKVLELMLFATLPLTALQTLPLTIQKSLEDILTNQKDEALLRFIDYGTVRLATVLHIRASLQRKASAPAICLYNRSIIKKRQLQDVYVIYANNQKRLKEDFPLAYCDSSWGMPLWYSLVNAFQGRSAHNTLSSFSGALEKASQQELLLRAQKLDFSKVEREKINEQDEYGNTPLMYATLVVPKPPKHNVSKLLEAGANADQKNKKGENALWFLIHNSEIKDFYQKLYVEALLPKMMPLDAKEKEALSFKSYGKWQVKDVIDNYDIAWPVKKVRLF